MNDTIKKSVIVNLRKEGCLMTKHKVYTMSVASVYPHYVTKAEKKDVRKQKSMKFSVG